MESITQPEWLTEQQQDMERRLFNDYARLARECGEKSRTGPEHMRETNARRAMWYVERAAVFAKGGPRA